VPWGGGVKNGKGWKERKTLSRKGQVWGIMGEKEVAGAGAGSCGVGILGKRGNYSAGGKEGEKKRDSQYQSRKGV